MQTAFLPLIPISNDTFPLDLIGTRNGNGIIVSMGTHTNAGFIISDPSWGKDHCSLNGNACAAKPSFWIQKNFSTRPVIITEPDSWILSKKKSTPLFISHEKLIRT